MSTHRIPLLGNGTIPDSSGSVYWQPYDQVATNKKWKYGIWVFKDTATAIGLWSGIYIPANYVGSAKFGVIWTSTVTSNNVVWKLDYRVVDGNDSESLDQSGSTETVSGTYAAPGAAHRRMVSATSITSANLGAGKWMQLELLRDGSSGSDTMAGDAYVHYAYLEYADV